LKTLNAIRVKQSETPAIRSLRLLRADPGLIRELDFLLSSIEFPG
jgi:hypothetical protein